MNATWWQRRRMDLAHVWYLIRLRMDPPMPRLCDARHYTDKLHLCNERPGHDGPHRDFWTTWEASR